MARRTIAWAGVASGFLLLSMVAACFLISCLLGNPEPPTLGNLVPPHPAIPPLRLAVFGDTQKGLATFAALLEKAKAEGAELAVHTGDLVSRADEAHYRLAKAVLSRAGFEAPFLVAPGNHDLKGDPTLFERHVGPKEMAFRWGGIDLVILDNALGFPDLERVERVFRAARGPIIVFCHIPPLDVSREPAFVRPGYEAFAALLGKYPVRYVFSGHAHGYWRIEREGVIFIVNGVGGDYESWQLDQPAYLTLVDVEPVMLRDRAVQQPPVHGVRHNLEHLAAGHVVPLATRPWGIGLLLLLAGGVTWGGIRLLRRRS
ncbi:MAG: metallophosphoesterase [Planctomycetes bacterium]|nr:metallophosphoesterase [Planctomycetota bacterium]